MGDAGFIWKPETYVTEPKAFDTVQVRRDAWWLTNENGDVCFYVDHRGYEAPQMNASRGLAERFSKRTEGCTGIKQIPVAFLPIDPRDYR